MSFLTTIGKDFKAVFSWLGSSKGQTVVATGEAVAESFVPAITPIITIANSWIEKAITTEALATAAGSQTGSGTQKAAAVLSAMGPQLAIYFPSATAAQLSAANDAIVAFLNALDAPAVVTKPVPVISSGN